MNRSTIHISKSLLLRGLLPLLTFLVIFSSCRREDDPAEPTLSRTVLFYMLSDGSLDSFFQSNINDMMSGMRNNNTGHLLVYFDSSAGGKPTLRRINSNGTYSVVKTYDYEVSPSSSRMREVIQEVFTNYPSTSYGMVISSHGMGWYPSKSATSLRQRREREQSINQVKKPLPTRYIGGNRPMSISQLAEALPNYPLFDFLMFDACFMSNIETMYDLRNAARHIIGSSTEILAEGFPYQTVIPLLFQENKLKEVCETFYNHYNAKIGEERSAAITLVKTAELEALATSVSPLLKEKTDEQVNAISGVQICDKSYSTLFYDLKHFLSKLEGESDRYTAFEQQFQKTVLYEAHTPMVYSALGQYGTFDATHISGISCYIPYTGRADNNAYYQTNWAKRIYGL